MDWLNKFAQAIGQAVQQPMRQAQGFQRMVANGRNGFQQMGAGAGFQHMGARAAAPGQGFQYMGAQGQRPAIWDFIENGGLKGFNTQIPTAPDQSVYGMSQQFPRMYQPVSYQMNNNPMDYGYKYFNPLDYQYQPFKAPYQE